MGQCHQSIADFGIRPIRLPRIESERGEEGRGGLAVPDAFEVMPTVFCGRGLARTRVASPRSSSSSSSGTPASMVRLWSGGRRGSQRAASAGSSSGLVGFFLPPFLVGLRQPGQKGMSGQLQGHQAIAVSPVCPRKGYGSIYHGLQRMSPVAWLTCGCWAGVPRRACPRAARVPVPPPVP